MAALQDLFVSYKNSIASSNKELLNASEKVLNSYWQPWQQVFRWISSFFTDSQPEKLTRSKKSKKAPQPQSIEGLYLYDRGDLASEISKLFKEEGINIIITSGKREAGAAGNAGEASHHVRGNACDIVPGKGENWKSLRKKMLDNPRIMDFFLENGIGVLDETTAEALNMTGGKGAHYHIGPDKLARATWSEWSNRQYPKLDELNDQKQAWTREIYSAFVSGLKDEYGDSYDDATYERIATYMTQQAAIESGYGESASGYNYGGHMKDGERLYYDTMDEFTDAHLKTLKKWDIMESKSLKGYVDALYKGKYRYNTSDTPREYYKKIKGTTKRVQGYLGMSAKYGGKFAEIRQYYGENFS